MTARSVLRPMALALFLLLAACGQETAPSSTGAAPASRSPAGEPASAAPSDEIGVEPAPGPEGTVYPPNPAAIVVAIDPGHGGCLDWGVPDPSQRGVEWAEKTMTLGMARKLRDRLESEGVTVVMIRDADEALAGDHHPPLGCDGPAWRDVNGDGESGFDPEGATRTRDELQARLDLANLVGADVLVSIHVNSPFDAGQPVEIAFTETFYTDETPWGATATEPLARAIQDGVVAELGTIADYERGDRGITAHNFYLVAPTLFEPTPERPDPRKQPTRNALMPTVLAEVGSITLRAEHDLLASAGGQAAVANGIFGGLVGYFAQRPLAARIGLEGVEPGAPPQLVPGSGPPFAPRSAPEPLRVRVTNTGTEAIANGASLVLGWGSDVLYLAAPPDDLETIGPVLPELAPGESIVVEVDPGPPDQPGDLAWISLEVGQQVLADLGSPPLQLKTAH